MLAPNSDSYFAVVDSQEIKPISDIYNPSKLFEACKHTNMQGSRVLNGIIAKKDGKLYDLAGRHRNFSATLFSYERNSASGLYIPVMVVKSLEGAIATYEYLLTKPEIMINEIDEDITQRWHNLAPKSKRMSDLGYGSLANVVEKHHFSRRQSPPPAEPALF